MIKSNMYSILIRDAKVADAKDIAKIHVKTWQYAYKGMMPDDFLKNLSIEKRNESWTKQLANLNEGVHAIVAETDEQIVGWCTFGKSRDNDASTTTGELHGIYVNPENIGTGVGSKLMEKVIEVLKNEGYIKATLWVLNENIKTRKWYESKGWKQDGVTKSEQKENFQLDEIRYLINL